jgi:Ca-activated chloride channel family protein
MKRMGTIARFIQVATLLAMFALVPSAGAQEAVRLTIHQVDDSSFPDVQAFFTAVDSAGLPIAGLEDTSFSVSEDNSVVAGFSLQELSDDSLPITVVLVLDASESMVNRPIEDVKTAAQGFVASLSSADQVGVVVLSEEARVAAALTQDKASASSAIQTLEASGRSPLHDAIVKAVDVLKDLPAGRKAVIVLSDGHDDGSTFSLRDAIDEAEFWSIPIYPIGFGSVKRDALEKIADLTGGYVQIRPDTSELEQAFGNVLDLLRQHYMISFTSTIAADGTQHTLSINFNHRGAEYSATHSFNARPGEVSVALEGIADGQAIGGLVRLKPTISAPAPVAEVAYYLDGDLIITVYDAPFNYTWQATREDEGTHTLNITATDEAGNVGSEDYAVEVRPAVKVRWVSPLDGASVSTDTSLQVDIDSLAGISKVAFYQDDQETPIAEILSEPYQAQWDISEVQPGQHTLRVEVTDLDHQTANAEINLTVALRGIPPMLIVVLLVVIVLVGVLVPVGLRRRRRITKAGPAAPPQTAQVVEAARLVELEGHQPGTIWPLAREEMRIGRKRDVNEVHVKGRSASRRHAEIHRTEAGFKLFNLNPQNPTYVNDKAVTTETNLSPGDVLHIGESTFRFEAEEASGRGGS